MPATHTQTDGNEENMPKTSKTEAIFVVIKLGKWPQFMQNINTYLAAYFRLHNLMVIFNFLWRNGWFSIATAQRKLINNDLMCCIIAIKTYRWIIKPFLSWILSWKKEETIGYTKRQWNQWRPFDFTRDCILWNMRHTTMLCIRRYF